MLLSLAIVPWLLVTNVSSSVIPSRPKKGVRVITKPDDYMRHAQQNGMCRVFNETENLKRKLVLPGPGILAPFKDCVAKNEFQEELLDHSGQIFCEGPVIHLMADAMNHADSKEFVDRGSTLDGVAFNNKFNGLLEEELTVEEFLKNINDKGKFELRNPGTEVHLYNNTRFPNTPKFIAQIRPQARLLRAWSKIVHHYWNNLDRTMQQVINHYLIPGPGSSVPDPNPNQPSPRERYSTSLIRLEHPFVVAGGRFREQYYWDSFFIMEGLLAANMDYLARTTLLNFMDQIKAYGFIPNGGRKYYLNRSQPPLFTNMLQAYVEATKDYQILHEALPLAEREIRWWYKHRAVSVYHNDKTYRVLRYNVDATGPRPESYAEDWRSVWCFAEKAPTPSLQRLRYSEFASGAESGWDYTARWMSQPFNHTNRPKLEQMNFLQITNIIPVDLNSIMYRCHKLMERLYVEARSNESPFADEYIRRHRRSAKKLRTAILALHWDPKNLAFFDFVMHEYKRGERRTGYTQRFWSGASLVPYWAGVWPDELDCSKSKNEEAKKKIMGAFSGVRDLLEMYPGPLPATLVETKQQWDFPNSWPPLQYFAIKALENIDQQCIDGTTTDQFQNTTKPKNHLGEKDPPPPIKNTPKINYNTSPSWRDVLLKTVVMRYINAAFCTWNNEGKLPEDRVEILMRDNPVKDENLFKHPGNMYEKLNAASPVAAGGGGEYNVQTGFGWTNGVAIWIGKRFGAILDSPNCVDPTASSTTEFGDSIIFQK
ncbi:trehalase [Ceratobasidium sp. AG-Ba]|nr:trehalase [Ceratobasidium sp. AG-Ba]QRV99547.1 trehalase [Ceratobasidium sp. AG-Ba]QRW14069.1 trehalase [Ceratobasidium sp. AG-Ba]